ncbi:hypothetical protein PR048_019358 [Dryococelus australis]|uniref:Uncharacterized protein n=1 Tax=Dryococelus australis TaxID=614101 RepID=A0ABQ9H3E2_9NEOP|nr:hypothetical protein PR048_019358 [Dryococelus australis]
MFPRKYRRLGGENALIPDDDILPQVSSTLHSDTQRRVRLESTYWQRVATAGSPRRASWVKQPIVSFWLSSYYERSISPCLASAYSRHRPFLDGWRNPNELRWRGRSTGRSPPPDCVADTSPSRHCQNEIGVLIKGATVNVVARALASYQGETGSIPGGVAPVFSHLAFVSVDGAGQRVVFSGISRFPAIAFRNCSMLTTLRPHLSRGAQSSPLHYLELIISINTPLKRARPLLTLYN